MELIARRKALQRHSWRSKVFSRTEVRSENPSRHLRPSQGILLPGSNLMKGAGFLVYGLATVF